MMRCGEHREDLSSGDGVCASCLRGRLAAVLAAQQKQLQVHRQESYMAAEKRCLPTPQIPPNRRRFVQLGFFRSKSDISSSESPRSSTSWLSSIILPNGHRFSISHKSNGRDSPAKSECAVATGKRDKNRNWQTLSPPGTGGFGICLSPLVWSSPRRYASKCRQSGALDHGGGDLYRGNMPTTLSFGINRSRKLFNIGRR